MADLYSTKVSEENRGALGMGDRLTERGGLLNDVEMKRVIEIAECGSNVHKVHILTESDVREVARR